MPLFAGLIWWGYTTIERNQAITTAQSVLDSIPELQGYPTTLDVGYRGQTVRVNGLAPDKIIATRLDQGLTKALPQANVKTKLAILPKRESIDQDQLMAGCGPRLPPSKCRRSGAVCNLLWRRAGRRMALAGQEVERIRTLADRQQHGQAVAEVEASIKRISQAIDTYTVLRVPRQRICPRCKT